MVSFVIHVEYQGSDIAKKKNILLLGLASCVTFSGNYRYFQSPHEFSNKALYILLSYCFY